MCIFSYFPHLLWRTAGSHLCCLLVPPACPCSCQETTFKHYFYFGQLHPSFCLHSVMVNLFAHRNRLKKTSCWVSFQSHLSLDKSTIILPFTKEKTRSHPVLSILGTYTYATYASDLLVNPHVLIVWWWKTIPICDTLQKTWSVVALRGQIFLKKMPR